MALSNPNLSWYTEISREKGLLPRCPFASVHRCPRYYQSLSLMGSVGSTKIDPGEEKKLFQKWSRSELWPATDEQATSVGGSPSQPQTFSNFCPEVAFDQLGVFASFLADYADEIDRGAAHSKLNKRGVATDDWRWTWASVIPKHYSECPLYSPLSYDSSKEAPHRTGDSENRILNLRPGFLGISLNLHAVYDRLSKWWHKRRT